MVGGGQGTWGPAKIIVKHTAAPLRPCARVPAAVPPVKSRRIIARPAALGEWGRTRAPPRDKSW